MLELSDEELKMTMTNTLGHYKKADNMQEQMGNTNIENKILRMNQKEIPQIILTL